MVILVPAVVLTALIMFAPWGVWRFIGYSSLTFTIMVILLSTIHHFDTLPR